MSEPTPGEIIRRLDTFITQIQQLSQDQRSDKLEASKTYVRKDLYEEQIGNLKRRVKELEEENDAKDKAASDFRRQIAIALIVLALPAVVSLFLAVNNFLVASGGK